MRAASDRWSPRSCSRLELLEMVTEAAQGPEAVFRLPPQPHGDRHGGTTAEGTNRALTNAYAQHSGYSGRNPDTGPTVGSSDVNTAQAGVKHQA
jgi:hypothetical protein